MRRSTTLLALLLSMMLPATAQRGPGSEPFVGWPNVYVVVAGQPLHIPFASLLANDLGTGLTVTGVDPLSSLGVPVTTLGEEVIYLPPPLDFSDWRPAFFDIFYYTATSDDGLSGRAPVHIHIVNNPPVAVQDYFVITQGADVSLPVLANDFDPDGHAMSVVSVTAPDCGTASTDGTSVTVNFPESCPDEPISLNYEIEDAFGMLNFAGDRLEVYFDPAYSVHGSNLLEDGGFEFGTADNPWKYPPEPDLIQCAAQQIGMKPKKYVSPHSGECMLYANNLTQPVTVKQTRQVTGAVPGESLHIEVWAAHLSGTIAQPIVIQAILRDADDNVLDKIKLTLNGDFDSISRPTSNYFSTHSGYVVPTEEFALSVKIRLSPGGKYWLDDVGVVVGGATTFDWFKPPGPPTRLGAPASSNGWRGVLPLPSTPPGR